jgi:hypothetical protein
VSHSSPGHGWQPPAEEQLIAHLDLHHDPFGAAPDEVAPVDRQADPAHWLPGRALTIAAIIVGIALIATVVICLIVWATPPMHHLPVPSVPKG